MRRDRWNLKDLPESFRLQPPREVEVEAEEHHCTEHCIHLRAAWRRGFAAGCEARDEGTERESERARERETRPDESPLVLLPLVASLSFLGGVFVAAVLRLAIVTWDGH